MSPELATAFLGPRLRGDERRSGRFTPVRPPLVMIVAVMIAAVRMAAVLFVGALLRIEWRLDRRQAGAEPAQHVLDHVVAANAQPIADDLHVDVAVADVPGEPRQLVSIRRRRSRPAAPAGRRCARCAPSSSTRPSPSRKAVACGRSSRNVVPRSPVKTTRRRWRSCASSVTLIDRAGVVPLAG